MRPDLGKLFFPESVCIIGASRDTSAIGHIVLKNLINGGFGGAIFPVNPKADEILGMRCYRSILDVPSSVDLAIVVVPAPFAPAVIGECGEKRVPNAIVITAGFRESGEKGRALEAEVLKVAREKGIRIVGPNCMGLYSSRNNLTATFTSLVPPEGGMSFISQSGAVGVTMLAWAKKEGIGFSKFISLGNEADLSLSDFIEYFTEDRRTQVITVYMESVKDGRSLVRALKAATIKKPVVVMKVGTTSSGAKAAASHTGAMAGDDAVYEAAFSRTGAVRVGEIAELFNAAQVLDSKKLPAGPRLAIVTSAGGPGVMATDALIHLGGELAVLSEESMKQLNALLPPYWSKANPVDVLGDATVDRFAKAIAICLDDPMVDGVLIIYVPMDSAPSAQLAQAVADSVKNAWKPVIATWMGAEDVREGSRIFVENSIPNYDTPEEAVRTYMNMCRYKRHLDELYETPEELPAQKTPSKDHLKELLRMALKEGRILLNEEESKGFLMTYGIPVTIAQVVQDSEAAVSVAEKVGYPVVIKVVSPDISHKSDVGGVVVGIDSNEALKEAYEKLIERVKERAPTAAITGVAVEKMFTDIDYELILGSKKDKDFGSVILFGMGGTMAEFIKDFSIGLPPINQTLAKMLMQDTKVYKMLQGFRSKPAADFEGLEEILVNFSNLVVDFPEIAEIDINPLAISNGKASALDARIIIDKNYDATCRSTYPHLIISPYPTRYTTPWQLSDGTEVLLRAIRPEDEPAEHEMLSSLSKESLRTRFFSTIKDISHEWLILFCNIDYDRHMAIVAEMKENGKKSMIGVARLIMNQDLTSGEVAVLVQDRFQGKRLGTKFVEMLIEIAKERGLEDIRADVLTENKSMLNVFKRLGFAAQWVPGGTSEAVLRLKE